MSHCVKDTFGPIYNSFNHDVQNWAAIRTGAHWERKLADALISLNIPLFLPVIERVKKYKTRLSKTCIPIFSGYLFFGEDGLSEMSKLSLESKRYIAQVLKTNDSALLYQELSKVSDFVQNKRLVDERIHGREGDNVIVKTGAFSDHHGIIKSVHHEKRRITLAISYLGASVELELDSDAIVKQ